MDSSNNLRKRLYLNLLNKEPKQNHLLGSNAHTKSAILKPKVAQQAMNQTAKMTSPVFQRGKLRMQAQMKSPQVPKKIAPIQIKDKVSKEGKAIIEEGKLKSKANLKPHDIFAFYEAFPQMSEDFFYLNRIGHPYDYQIVTYSQRNPLEYMTISFKGITLYHEKQAEFMTKEQWLADQKIYYSLQRIQFFKQYKISKNFTIWKNRMRRHYMKEMSNLLNESLFFSFEHPRHCLLQVRKVTNHLKESAYFMPSNSIESEDPQEFKKNAQQYIQTQFISKLKEVQNLVVEQLQIAIDEEIKKFKLQNNIKINDVGDHDEKQHKQGYVYSQEAILRKQYKKVSKLIKLADNIILESKIELFHQCLLQLIDRIEEVRSSDSKSEWIKCTAKLIGSEGQTEGKGRSTIQWNPTMQGLKTIFKELTSLTIVKMSDEHEKISMRQKFKKYRANEQSDNRKDEKRNTLKYMIQESPFYSPLMRRVQKYLEEEFRKTQKQESQLIKFIDIYTKHKSLPQIRDIFRQHSASQYIQLVRQWRQDDIDMHMLPVNKSGGLLIFDYSLLRSAMHEVPKKTLTSFLAQLPEETRKKYNDLVNESENHLEHINNYPINMEEFVEFNKAVKKATAALDDLIDNSKALIQMVALIEENKSHNHDINKINSKKAIQNINKLKAKVDQSNAKYDQSLSKFKKELQSRITRVKTTVKQLSSKFEVIPFDNITSQVVPILERLQQIFPSIEKLEEEAQNIQQIEWQLSLTPSQLEQIHTLYKKSIDIKNLWQCKQKWNDLLLQIYHKHYKTIDCKELKGKWEEFARKNTELQRNLIDNEVLKKLIGQISEFENLLETIAALTSPNLEEKSWRQISEYLAYQLNIQDQRSLPFSNQNYPEYTVEWLINNNISLYKEKISFIVQKSQKEKELQANLGEFKNFISSITFETVIKKRQVSLIEKNDSLQNNLKQKISILYSLIGNQYSDALKNQAQVMIKHYEYMEQILEGMYNFRKEWQKYEPFFENNAVSTKLLTKESKEFSSWQMQWKKIIKNIINDPAYFYRKICDETLGVNCSRAIIKSMNKANMFLDLVKKGIEEFLEKKRLQFPRYCLFTDEQLLHILSKLDIRHLIVPEIIPILYDNIKLIQYDEQSGTIISVIGPNNQKLQLIKQTAFKSQLEMEDLLKITQEQIKKTMAQSIRNTFNKYIEEDISRESLLSDNNVQIALLVDYIAWVRLAEETYLINEPVGSMQDWLNIQEQQIKEVSILMKKASPEEYFKYLQFMVQSIYFREKTLSLAKNNITDTMFYQWQRIPKIVMSNSDIHLRQLQSKLLYNYELLNQNDVVVIQSETQKVWLNLINALAGKENKNIIGLQGNHLHTIKDLAFYVGQSLKSIKFSQNCNIKTVERLLTGYMYIGCWMHFMPIENQEILSYIAYHLNSLKRPNNFESTSSALQLTRSNMLNNSFSNSVFLFEKGENLVVKNFIDGRNFRNISLNKPDEKYIMSILCEAEEIPKEIGQTLVKICQFFRSTFDFGKIISHQYQRNLLKQIKENVLLKFSENQLSDPQILDYVALTTVEQNVSIYFTDLDIELFQNFKNAFIPNYLIFRSRYNHRFAQNTEDETHVVSKYIENCSKEAFLTKEFVITAIKIYDMIMNNSKLGVILSGQILSGKSQMMQFIQKVHRFEQKQKSTRFEVHKLYPNAYKSSDIFKLNSQEKRQKKDKNDKIEKSEKERIEKINQQVGIFQNFLRQEAPQKWIVLDGKIQKQLLEYVQNTFDSIIVPNYGLISKQKYEKPNLQKVKIIIETLNSSQLPPSMYYNYSVCHINPQTNTVQSLVHSFFLRQQIRKYLKFLTEDSISYFKNQLIFNLSKIQQKGAIRSKPLDFLYPFADNQITIKCLKMVQCVFKLNQQSIRQKEKNMRKTIQKFIAWIIMIVLYLHGRIENVEIQQKFEKKYMQIFKCEHFFTQSIIKYIVYPSSGIQVHPVNGLRTQSSLFEIPQKGIVTLISKNDFSDFNNFVCQKNNKFYEEINLQTTSMIRVNHDESNLFNYYSQLYSYCNQPMVLTGPTGTGKKSILELYAKNIRHKSFVHSIRYNHNRPLIEIYQKPFRKYNSLNGVILKSVLVTKNVVVFVEDINLVREQNQSLQFLRMLTNDNNFINKNGQSRKLTQQNNSLSILSNRINLDENVRRLATRLMFFQTNNNSAEKLSSIYLPYLKAWSKANGIEGEVQRIFSSPNGDTLLDATIKVFELMEETFKHKKSEQKYSVETIVLKPRIGDISRVLSCICLTQNANQYGIAYYSEVWAHQIMKVFQDRLSPAQEDISKSLLDLIKKQLLLKFKLNFSYNPTEPFVFTSLLSKNEDIRTYEKIQKEIYLEGMIKNAQMSQQVTVPLRLCFRQVFTEILKIYRILQITNGHMVVFHLNKKVRKCLIEVSCQIAQTNFINLKQNLLTVQKDILKILQDECDVGLFEDLEDISSEQIYQFSCLLNKNHYDYDLKGETREKVKSKVLKIMRQMLNEINAARENGPFNQKTKLDSSIKEKQNIYLNQKVEDELQSTMQQIIMNNVHFVFGASPTSQGTRSFLLNQVDIVSSMHFSFFDVPEASLFQVSKQIFINDPIQQNLNQSQNPNEKMMPNTGETNEEKQQRQVKQQNAQRISQKCTKIYKSLPQIQRDYDAFLCICQNIVDQQQKLKTQSKERINRLKRSIENYKRAQSLITQNEQKLNICQNQLQIIKKEQAILSEQLQEKGNEINDLQLNVTESGEANEQEEEKNSNLKKKNEEFEKIQDQLREIKMKKDKNDMQTRQARKIIQLSKDFIEIVDDVSTIEISLEQQKVIGQNIESLVALWWSMICFSSNKDTSLIIEDLNRWMQMIDFKSTHKIQTPDDVLTIFELVISPISSGLPVWESISPSNRLKCVILAFILMHHDQTTSANRIISLYDPFKIYQSIFENIPLDSQLGYFSLVKIFHKYESETFWPQTCKQRRGLIFLEQTIDSRQKKQIEGYILKNEPIELNRLVSLTNNRQKSDVSFIPEKLHFLNCLKLICLKNYEPAKALQLLQVRSEYIRESKKLKQLESNFILKRSQMRFDMESDTEELNRLKRDIKELQTKSKLHKQKLKLSEIQTKDEELIIKIVDQLYKAYTKMSQQGWAKSHQINFRILEKMFKIIKEKTTRFVSELRESLQPDSKVNIIQTSQKQTRSPRQSQLISNKHIEQINSISNQQNMTQTLEYSNEQIQLVNQLIDRIVFNNFSSSQKIQGEDLPSLNLVSLQLEEKVPIVVIQNNLLNYSLINKQNRPINLLYNQISNVLVESINNQNSEDKFGATNNKIFLFYNDHMHFGVLMDLVSKYVDEFKNCKDEGKIQKKHCIYLFTNSELSLLKKNQYKDSANYKLFYYERSNRNIVNNSSMFYNTRELNEKSTKAQMYIKMVQHLTGSKFYNNLSEVSRYSEALVSKWSTHLIQDIDQLTKSELKAYLQDISQIIPNQEDLLEKIILGQIKFEEINQLTNNKQIDEVNENSQKIGQNGDSFEEKQQLCEDVKKGRLEKVKNVTKTTFDEIQDELPYMFNTADLLSPPTKDSFSFEIQSLAKNYNKKMKKLKHFLQQNLQQHTLNLNKLPIQGKQIYLMPTPSYIRELNKEYKTIKKLLSQNGMLIGPSPSMGKIVSSKGIGFNANSESNLLAKNCMSMEDLFFNMRILNELKIRASKKLKIPFNRVGLLWALQKKSENIMYSTLVQKMLSSASTEITLAVNATLVNGQLKNINPVSKQEKDSSKLLSMLKNISNKSLRLLAIPYDNNTCLQAQNLNNVSQILAETLALTTKKKTIFGDTGFRKQENSKERNPTETIKVRIVLDAYNQNTNEISEQEIGFVEIPQSEIVADNLLIESPKLIISSMNQQFYY